VREQLPAGLAAPQSKIRTATGAAIAAVYNFDGDSGWPGLIEMLVGAIQQRGDPNLGRCCRLGVPWVFVEGAVLLARNGWLGVLVLACIPTHPTPTPQPAPHRTPQSPGRSAASA